MPISLTELQFPGFPKKRDCLTSKCLWGGCVLIVAVVSKEDRNVMERYFECEVRDSITCLSQIKTPEMMG